MARMSADINVIVQAVEKAARSLLRDFNEVDQLQVSMKAPADFVSAADRRAESILHKELSASRPGYGFIMEEGGSVKGDADKPVFVIDPLDGTTNFLHGLPHWCISVAIVKDGEPIAAVVFAPVTNELFWAEKGRGAYADKKGLRVSGKKKLEYSMLAYGELSPRNAWYKKLLNDIETFGKKGASLRRYGAAALDLSYVASGRFEAFWETGIKVWDVAAGILIVQEAKGKVVSLSSKNNDPLTSGSILATNGLVHEDVQSTIGNVDYK